MLFRSDAVQASAVSSVYQADGLQERIMEKSWDEIMEGIMEKTGMRL